MTATKYEVCKQTARQKIQQAQAQKKSAVSRILGLAAVLLLSACAQPITPPESTLLFAPGDAGAKFYRIPAIVTAADGSLIAAVDKRIEHMGDLPNRIDVAARRSEDNGKTWSEPITIAAHQGDCGYGDPALVVERNTGDVLCIAASGAGLFQSTPSMRTEVNVIRSRDNGKTWSEPERITPSIYGAECPDTLTQGWHGVFAASGRALQLRDGTILFVIAARKGEATTPPLCNYVCASYDGGYTWQVLPAEVDADGDEAKLAELEDGTLLMSIRNPHKGSRKYALSHDRGMSWSKPLPWEDMQEPACNGDMMRYTSTQDGFSRNRLLHSIPFDPAERRNVSLMMSYDEGRTWPVRKTIWEGDAGYSALTILDDGSIGLLTEVGNWDGFEIWFTRITPEWLTDGTDSFK